MIDKELWEKSIASISSERIPEWPCPNCADGKLALEKDSLRFQYSVNQYRPEEFRKEDFENGILLGAFAVLGIALARIYWRQARFNAFLKCNSCGEIVTFCGRAEIPRELQKQPSYIESSIIPEFFSPPLLIFPLRKEYPLDVRKELIKSFSMFFSDSGSSGNKLRICIERLLDNQTVPKVANLHHRIQEFQKINKDLGEMLLAVKWLGNEASHVAELEKKDLLAAYEIIEYVLEKLFVMDSKHTRMKKLSTEIQDRYKPGD